MPTSLPDGSTLYEYPDTFTDIALNGASILDLGVYAVRVWPDGRGYVLAKKLLPTDQIKTQIDGQIRNHYQYGNVTITL
jgi:hypothetical protein